MIISIIQARMSSTRLPGKVLKTVLGKTLLNHQIDRIKRAKKIDRIIVATSNDDIDDAIELECKKLEVRCYRGSREDLLERYWGAYNSDDQSQNCTGIVRITADCPLIEPAIIDEIVNLFLQKGYDYVTTSSKVAEGLDVEVFRPELLKIAHTNACLSSEREHLTQYFHNNSEKFKIYKYDNGEDLGRYRLTVDEPQDFEVVKIIFEEFKSNGLELNFQNIKSFLDNNPSIYEINSNVLRNEGLKKSLMADKKIK